MSTGITSCCAPVAAAPVSPQQPAIEGGGPPSKDGTTGGGDVVATTAPEPAAQPQLPVEAVTGGGPVQGGGATCYQPAPAPDPVQCGQWVPAPVATGDTPPTTAPSPAPAPAPAPAPGPDTPPDPIAAPVESPSAPATGPASSRPTWPEWQQYFTRLGVSQQDLAKIGSANLNDEQLAQVYTDIHENVIKNGGIPGQTPVTGAPAWDTEWEQKFAALGLPPQFLAEIKSEALRTGADDAKLDAIYQQLATGKAGVPGQTAWSPEWEQKFLALGLPADLVAQIKQQAIAEGADATKLDAVYQSIAQKVGGAPDPNAPVQQDGPGWNAQFEQAFRSLGMPDEVIKLYAESGAPASGLEAAYKHAAGRVEDFTKRGWMQKFQAAGIPPMEIWGSILGDQPMSDKDAQAILDAKRKSQESMWQKGGQLATSLFPGGRLLQYAFGKEFVSGDKIDRTDWKEIGFAALSGLAAFATIRGARTVGQGIAARNGNFSALNGVNDTLATIGMPKGATTSMSDAAMGATQTWGAKQKILAFIPGTALHKEVVGLGHAEAAARAFNGGGAARILANDADGALQLATITRMFDDIKSGAVGIQGSKFAYLGPFKGGAPMTLKTLKDGQEVISVAKNLRIGNGNAQLVGLMEVAGTKLGKNPEWLTNAVGLTDDIGRLSTVEQNTLGNVMAGNLAKDLGGFDKFSLNRSLRYIQKLGKGTEPWYQNLANATKAQWPNGATQIMPEELFSKLATSRLYTGMFDEATATLKTIDRSKLNLSPEAAKALDETMAAMDEARAGWASVKAGGKIEDALPLQNEWTKKLSTLTDTEPELARTLFPNAFDEGGRAQARIAAGDFVRAEWAASLPKVADDAAGVADDVAGLADDAAGVADDVAHVADDIAEAEQSAPAAVNAADDAAEGAARTASAATAPTPASAPMPANGTGIGSNWKPENANTKFTGSIDDYVARAQRTTTTAASRPAAAAPAANAAPTNAAAAPSLFDVSVDASGRPMVAGGRLYLDNSSSLARGIAVPSGELDHAALARLADAQRAMRA